MFFDCTCLSEVGLSLPKLAIQPYLIEAKLRVTVGGIPATIGHSIKAHRRYY
jgi:hypothetical protein